MSATYSKDQQIYSFSFSAGSAYGLSFSSQGGQTGIQRLQAFVSKVAKDVLANTIIQGLIGSDWEMVWGPIVYSNDPGSVSIIADNTMGVYYSPSQHIFVIAIAGTNISSFFDWVIEDFNVNKLVSWKSITGTGSGNISEAADTGLKKLLNMKDNNNNTMLNGLKNFITDNNISGAEAVVAGHSLGGALSPTLALYMLDKRDEWDPTNTMKISTYPTAGPSPGDKKFASYYESQIKKGYISYTSKYNTLDIVPLAWEKDTLATIPSIYQDNITSPAGANPQETVIGTMTVGLSLIALAAKNILGVPYNPYNQISPWTAMKGTFDQWADDEIQKKIKYINWVLPSSLEKYSPYFKNFVRSLVQAANQHTTAYHGLLNITDFMTQFQEIVNSEKPADITMYKPGELAVKNATGIDLKTIDEEAMAKAAKR